MATTMIPDKPTFPTKHYHLHSNKTPTVTCFSIQVRPRFGLRSSLQFALNHFSLRSSPALQEETNKARQRAEESRQDEEDGDSLAHIQHSEKHNGTDHHSNSADGDSVCIKKTEQSAIPAQQSRLTDKLTQRIPSKQPPLPPNTQLNLPVQNPPMLSSKNVKIHGRTILTEFLPTANLPTGDNTARFVFLQPSLVSEETCEILANLSVFRREARHGAGGFESCWEDCAEETRHVHSGFLGGFGFLAARRQRVFFFQGALEVEGLGRVESDLRLC
jgi:hypothetical protein